MTMTSAHEYFSDREFGPRPPAHHEFSETTWKGLTALVQRGIGKGDFGSAFPAGCPDSPSTCCGTDSHSLNQTLQAEIPSWPGWDAVPDVATACDFLEFCHRHVALASSYGHHSYYKHDHFQFDVTAGQTQFRTNVNLLLRRNGVALQMTEEGLMVRMLDDPAGDSIRRAVFRTGDAGLDQLLQEARTKFLDPSPRVRQEALERAWDAWERLKTVKNTDKKRGATILLDACATESTIRQVLEDEAKALTSLGNNFRIRHFETTKPEVADTEHIDYLFQRMFSMLLLIMRMNGMLA